MQRDEARAAALLDRRTTALATRAQVLPVAKSRTRSEAAAPWASPPKTAVASPSRVAPGASGSSATTMARAGMTAVTSSTTAM